MKTIKPDEHQEGPYAVEARLAFVRENLQGKGLYVDLTDKQILQLWQLGEPSQEKEDEREHGKSS
jgi:hypothetical protein